MKKSLSLTTFFFLYTRRNGVSVKSMAVFRIALMEEARLLVKQRHD